MNEYLLALLDLTSRIFYRVCKGFVLKRKAPYSDSYKKFN